MTTEIESRFTGYMAARYPNVQISDFNFLVSGFESEIYTFRLQSPNAPTQNYILRLFQDAGADAKLRREAKGLDLLHRSGYPVPGLLLQESDPAPLGKPFEVLDRLEGQALWGALASDPAQATPLLMRFGQLLAQLHQFDWRPFAEKPTLYENNPTLLIEETLTHYRQQYTKFGLQGFLQILDWLDSHKTDITVRAAVVHQDFHANNVFLCSDNRLVVIDWTQCAVSDYRIDLCWTLLIMGDFAQTEWGKIILDAYAATSNYPIQDLDYFNVIVYTKLLADAVVAFKFDPAELGLQPRSAEDTRRQLPIYRLLYDRLQRIAGIRVPELENMLM